MGYSCWQVNTTCLFLFCCLSNIITLWKDIKTLTLTPVLHRLGKRPRRKSHTLDRLTVSYWFIYLFTYLLIFLLLLLFLSQCLRSDAACVHTPAGRQSCVVSLFCWPCQQVLYIHLSGCTLSLMPWCVPRLQTEINHGYHLSSQISFLMVFTSCHSRCLWTATDESAK